LLTSAAGCLSFKTITEDLSKNEKELSDVEDDILNLSGGLEESSLNADVVTLRDRLSRLRTKARERADQLQTMQSLWNQLEKYEQWSEAKTVQLKGYECLYYDTLSTVVSELQVILLRII
jgi:predicted nuclease with TOPRIM domain